MTTATATDVSGNGNDGTLVNGPSVNEGKIGQGLRFTGGESEHVYIGSPASLDDIEKISISIWFKPHAISGNTALMCKGFGGSSGGWCIKFSGSGGYVTWERRFFPGGPGYGEWSTSGLPAFTRDVWKHLIVTYDKSSTSSVPSMYLDGVPVTVITTLSPSGSALTDASLDLFIANRQNLDMSPLATLDDVRIYNRALSATEVAQLYQIGLGSIIDATADTSFTCGTDTVLDADANVYDTILIGSQCWMQQNLRVGTRISGATTQTDNATIEKWCYSNSDANCTSNNPNQPDGGLYQWNEAMQYSTTPGAQGICPAGWHIPTHDELTTLELAVSTTGSCATDFPYDTTTTGFRGTTEGAKLKPNGTSGFEFNLAGYGDSSSFFFRSSLGYLWSSSESGGSAWFRNVFSSSAQVGRDVNVKTYGFSVRCLQD